MSPEDARRIMFALLQPGAYYKGLDVNGNVGAVAMWNGSTFETSECDDVDMSRYPIIRPVRG